VQNESSDRMTVRGSERGDAYSRLVDEGFQLFTSLMVISAQNFKFQGFSSWKRGSGLFGSTGQAVEALICEIVVAVLRDAIRVSLCTSFQAEAAQQDELYLHQTDAGGSHQSQQQRRDQFYDAHEEIKMSLDVGNYVLPTSHTLFTASG
jgi:hypothetical protein